MGSRRYRSIYLTKTLITIASYRFLWPIPQLFYIRGSRGFPWVPVDFKVDLFYTHTNNYCFVQVPMANTMTFLHEGFPWVPVDFKVDLFYAHTNNYCFV